MEESRRKDPKEKKCAICGKDIYAGEDWAYKRRLKGERTKWFCSYKCMRAWDAKTEPKPKKIQEDTAPTAQKEPTSRAEQAKALAREILAGRSVIAWLKAEGYKNPHEAYSAVRHYAQTKMPELAETLKPLKDLPKAPAAKKQAEVVKVEKVPEPVQCIAHVDPADLAEVEQLNLEGGVNYQLKVDEAKKEQGFLYNVTGIDTEIGEFMRVSNGKIKWQAGRSGKEDPIMQIWDNVTEPALTPEQWRKLAKIIPEVLRVLGAEE